MTVHAPDIDYIDLAQVARHVITTRSANPGVVAEAFHLSHPTAELHLTHLEHAWGVVGRPDNRATRRVLIHPNHADHIVDVITKCHGIPPDLHPFSRLAMPGLSAQDHDIVRLVALGCDNKQIAARLGISENTVKSHLLRLFGVFEAANRTHLVTRAFECGLFGHIPRKMSDHRG